MPESRPLLTTACLTACLILSACAGDPGGAASATAPTAVVIPAATASLVVQVDKICAGRESNVRVFVDRADRCHEPR
jgi:hypothetical protein